jgi:3-oxoacyl-[acyl-carrier-protein] synthase II
MPDRTPVITGIGLVSCLGEGEASHWEALLAGAPAPLDAASFAPYPVHPIAKLALDTQIPRKGDQRQMENWQRIGTYAAGLALDQAGVKGNADLLARTDMIVAATGGERDVAADEGILGALAKSNTPDVLLNERLNADLRPTLFLAQLSNLLAGNISIVHGVVGSSRTFVGEESAGADALRVACARIEAGQSDIALAGGAYFVQRAEVFLYYAFDGLAYEGTTPGGVWARQDQGGGIVFGSGAAFLVIESQAHAKARGAKPLALVDRVLTEGGKRSPGSAAAKAERQFARLRDGVKAAHTGIISASSGVRGATAEELRFLRHTGLPFRAAASRFGHTVEAAFLMATALGVVSLQHGELPPPAEPAEAGAGIPGDLRHVIVNGWGHWRGEAMARLSAA